MINKYGFPIKNYYVRPAAPAPVVEGNWAMIVLLKAVTRLQKYLLEKLSVPGRVSAYGR